MRWTICLALGLCLVLSAARLAWSSRREGVVEASTARASPRRPSLADHQEPAAAPGSVDLDRVPGQVEALPQNVYHVVAYNDWPLYEISVSEGQRLRFHRAHGRWEGDHDSLTIQFETPAEIESRKEDIEIAALEVQSARLAEEVLKDELDKGVEAAAVRENNARQEAERLEKLLTRTAATDQETQRARSMLELARVQREQAVAVRQKRLARARLETQAAEHRHVRAESEFQLADFKREMSWANVPHRRNRFEEVVVTRVSAAIGDVPSGSGKREPWVEVIDDRVLQIRLFLPVSALDCVVVGRTAAVAQEGREYPGTIVAVNIVADPVTHLVPVLVSVANHDRALKINTLVTVDLVP